MVTRNDLLERDSDELERDLIAYGRRDRAPDAARRRTLASVTMAAATGAGLATVTSGAAAASGVAPWLVATKWLAIGIATGAVTLGVADGVQHRTIVARREGSLPITTPVAQPISTTGVPTSASSTVDVPLQAERVPEARGDAPAAPQSTRASARADVPSKIREEVLSAPLFPAASPSAEIANDSSLARELRILGEARAALDAHAPARARVALDRYAEYFPSGHMAIEANALRIELLILIGQRDEARALAQAFLTKHPRSPAAMRVARLLEVIDSGVAPQ
jgi:hypothetical protein